ncbi:hypothetical protein H1C71_039759 [Ictidomys tridecemlineatus]|nr:hypothetical protein H1C71_039759 [Ictidomys tridecemlineatus]
MVSPASSEAQVLKTVSKTTCSCEGEPALRDGPSDPIKSCSCSPRQDSAAPRGPRGAWEEAVHRGQAARAQQGVKGSGAGAREEWLLTQREVGDDLCLVGLTGTMLGAGCEFQEQTGKPAKDTSQGTPTQPTSPTPSSSTHLPQITSWIWFFSVSLDHCSKMTPVLQ